MAELNNRKMYEEAREKVSALLSEIAEVERHLERKRHALKYWTNRRNMYFLKSNGVSPSEKESK